MPFVLRFPATQLAKWAHLYSYGDDTGVIAIGQRARERGHLTKRELSEIGEWKSVRVRSRIGSNTDEEVEQLTGLAFRATGERLRVYALLALGGVGWPTASVLLHLSHRDPYPVLDFRALWSCGLDPVPSYTLELWLAYTGFCRDLARTSGLSMRAVDQALWQFSAQHQGPQSRA